MAPNKYISRYSKHDTHFKRTDPWPHLPWADEVEASRRRMILGEILGVLGLVAVLVFAALLPDAGPGDTINTVEVERK